MLDRIAVILTNYNMPERTDALCKHLLTYVDWPLSLFVVDNGSDLIAPSPFTTLRLKQNRQTTGGWLAGLEQARAEGEWLGYLFLITSTEFIPGTDPLSPMAELLTFDPQVAGVHPALTPDSTTDWPHLYRRNGGRVRQTWHIDNICSLYRAAWFDAAGGFDPALSFAWGLDLELGYKARQQGKRLVVHEGVQVKKVTDIGYQMNRMHMSAKDRRNLAAAEMAAVFEPRYGGQWWQRLTGEYITPAMLMPEPYRELERVNVWPS